MTQASGSVGARGAKQAKRATDRYLFAGGEPATKSWMDTHIQPLLGGPAKTGKSVTTQSEAHDLIVWGLPGKAIHELIDGLKVIAPEQGVETAIGMSLRTFQRTRHDPDKRLSSEQSGRAWTFASILAQAIDVFGGDREHAETWLSTPAMALEQRKPIELLASPEGVDMVRKLLGRIDHGVYT
jgi:putative toxin-antitoxin system antitoxin component (TIGR02293 family)